MAPNQTYIEKADMAIADLTSGGLLAPEQVKEFYELVIDESVLLPIVTTVPMSAPTWELSKMGFTGRVLRRATENQGLPEGDRAKPELGKVTLTSEELIAEARIPYAVVEDNIANGSFPQVALGFLSKAVARDLEDLVINGDVDSVDPFYNILNGILKQIGTYTVNGGGVRLGKTNLKIMAQTMPAKYSRAGNLALLTSKNAAIDFVDSLSNRQTPLGDAALVSRAAAEYMTYPLVPIPLFPENLGSGNKTNVLMLDPKNIHVGMHRDIRIETDRDISARQFIIVATLRAGVKLAHEPATVKCTEILASAGA
jgi:HK97 family phage major capsid protein